MAESLDPSNSAESACEQNDSGNEVQNDELVEIADIGVLLVHGIGEQEKASTLLRFGESLANWITRWIEVEDDPADESVRIINAELTSPDAPAHATLLLKSKQLDTTSRWLLAESWWSESFGAPSYLDLLTWVIRIFPWTIATHLVRRIELAEGYVEKSISIVAMIAGTALLPLIVTLLLILLTIGILPIDKLRTAILRLQHRLLGSIGDSYVLKESSIRGAAMSSKVRNDLAWLQQHCKHPEKTVIIAHSQGSAVAHAALGQINNLNNSHLSNPGLLITFGSGLRKLLLLDQVGKQEMIASWILSLGLVAVSWSVWMAIETLWYGSISSLTPFFESFGMDPRDYFGLDLTNIFGVDLTQTWLAWTGLCTIYVFYYVVPKLPTLDLRAILIRLVTAVMMASVVLFFILIGLGTFYLMVFAIAAIAAALFLGNFSGRNLEKRMGLPIRWIDMYGSSDPVPNGPLVYPLDKLPIESVTIHNYKSIFRDHNGYWSNRDQFVPYIACELGNMAASGFKNLRPWDRVVLDRAFRRREWRVRWLNISQWIAWVTIVLTAYFLRDEMWRCIENVPVLLQTAVEEIIALFGSVPILRLGVPEIDNPLLPQSLWLSVTFAILIIATFVVRAIWSWWDYYDLDVLFHRDNYTIVPLPFALILSTLTIFALLGFILVCRDSIWDFIQSDPEIILMSEKGLYMLYHSRVIGIVTSTFFGFIASIFTVILLMGCGTYWHWGSLVGGGTAKKFVGWFLPIFPVSTLLAMLVFRVGQDAAYQVIVDYSEFWVTMKQFLALGLILLEIILWSVVWGVALYLFFAAEPVKSLVKWLRSMSVCGPIGLWLVSDLERLDWSMLHRRVAEITRDSETNTDDLNQREDNSLEAVGIIEALYPLREERAKEIMLSLANAYPYADMEYALCLKQDDPDMARERLDKYVKIEFPRLRRKARRESKRIIS